MSISIAEQLEENEQYDKAYEEYKKIHNQRPKSIEVLERLGHLALILKKQEDAAEFYNKILELEPTNTVAYEMLMDVYFHTDRYKYYISRGNLHVIQKEFSHGISDFKKALDKAQTPEEINSTRFVLASLYEQNGKFHNAIDEYLRILDTSAINEVVFLNLANVYLKVDSAQSAIETLERAIENGFNSANIKENLAQLYLRNGQSEKAREHSSDDMVKIKSLLDEEKNQTAFELLEKIKCNYSKNSQYHSLLAQYYFNTKEWEKSLQSVSDFDNLEKNSPLTYQMRALIYEEQGKDFESHLSWAKYNIAKGDREVALNEYYLALQENKNDADLVQSIAELLEVMGDKTQSAEFWERLSYIDSKNKKALEKVAEFRESIGDCRGAIEFWQKLYELDSKKTLTVKKLAMAYEKNRNKEKALEFYNKFLSMAPVSDDYEFVKAKVTKLETSDMEEDEGLLGKIMGLFSKK